jgi:urease accessory protein UreF
LPAIHQAYLHASRYEVRELIESDWKLSQQPELRRFAGVSQCLGTAQLQKLRPLRDQRLVRRYWEAVENGEAHGWHTVVYGLVLALFSLPLRQGLLHYGQQVIRGFIESGGGAFKQSSEQSAALYASVCAPLPQAIERLLCAEAVVFAK